MRGTSGRFRRLCCGAAPSLSVCAPSRVQPAKPSGGQLAAVLYITSLRLKQTVSVTQLISETELNFKARASSPLYSRARARARLVPRASR